MGFAILLVIFSVNLEASSTQTEDGYIVEVLSNKLNNPQVKHDTNEWVECYEVARGNKFLYRAKKFYKLEEKDYVTLRNGEELFDLVVPELKGKEIKLDVCQHEPERIRPIRDVGLAIINRFRALRGLGPIKFDAEYARVSRVNNEMGGVHRYNTGWQTWASPADPESAVSMWMGAYYNSHGVIIMNPNITKGGTHSHPVYGTTFTGQ